MNISTENINTLAQLAASIADGDYIYIYKSASNSFARIEKSVLLSGVSDGATSTRTKSNVNALQAKIDELIDALAPLAYNGDIPSKIGALEWEDEVEPTPSAPVLTSPSGSTVNVGTNTGSGVSKSIYVKGGSITKALSVAVTGSGFSVSPQQISAASANSGTYVTVTYNGTAGSASGTLVISSSEVSVSVPLTARYSETPVVSTHNVNIFSSGLSNCRYTDNLGGTGVVEDGDDVAITIIPESGYTLQGVTANISATNGSVAKSYNSTSDRIEATISNITADTTITIAATAVQKSVEPSGYVTNGLVLHLDSDDLESGSVSKWCSKVPFNGSNIEFDMTNATKEEDGVVFNGTSSYGAAAYPNGFPEYDVATIEFVVKSMVVKNKAIPIRANVPGGAMLGYWHYPATIYGWVAAMNVKPQKRADQTIADNAAFSGYAGMSQSRCIINGESIELVDLNNSFTYSSSDRDTIMLGRSSISSGSSVDYTNMKLLAVRVYNRQLTESEMLQNYNADKAKYDI